MEEFEGPWKGKITVSVSAVPESTIVGTKLPTAIINTTTELQVKKQTYKLQQ